MEKKEIESEEFTKKIIDLLTQENEKKLLIV